MTAGARETFSTIRPALLFLYAMIETGEWINTRLIPSQGKWMNTKMCENDRDELNGLARGLMIGIPVSLLMWAAIIALIYVTAK